MGLRALLREAGLEGKALTSTSIGFVLAPRINAAGRMGVADIAADLFLTDDSARAEELARQLCELNRERQRVEQEIFAEAEARIARTPEEERRALVLESDTWHQGVVGIVASRLSEKICLPQLYDPAQRHSGQGFVPQLGRVQPVCRAGSMPRTCCWASAAMSWPRALPLKRNRSRLSGRG